jgi:hypothetical protein
MFYDNISKRSHFDTGDCLIEVSVRAGFTVYGEISLLQTQKYTIITTVMQVN